MKLAVLDASALLRVFLGDGPVPVEVERALEAAEVGDAILLAPELLWAEVPHVLHKRASAGEFDSPEGQALLDEMLALPIRTTANADLAADAMVLAGLEDLTVYDALYLQLARLRGAELLTCDLRLARAAGHVLGPPVEPPAATTTGRDARNQTLRDLEELGFSMTRVKGGAACFDAQFGGRSGTLYVTFSSRPEDKSTHDSWYFGFAAQRFRSCHRTGNPFALIVHRGPPPFERHVILGEAEAGRQLVEGTVKDGESGDGNIRRYPDGRLAVYVSGNGDDFPAPRGSLDSLVRYWRG